MIDNLIKFPEKKKELQLTFIQKSILFVGVFCFIFAFLLTALLMDEKQNKKIGEL